MALPKISPALLDFYRDVTSSVFTDSMLRLKVGAWMDDVAPVKLSNRVSGRARTVQFGVKTGVKRSSHNVYSFAETFEPGDVMVISARDTLGWLMGENVASFCMNCGVAGIVTDGRVRDLKQLIELPLPMFCRGATARSFKPDVEIVAVDVPIECGGAYVLPGDLVIADYDGVAVAPNEAAVALVAEAKDIAQIEHDQGMAIAQKKTFSEIRLIADRKQHRIGPEFKAAPNR